MTHQIIMRNFASIKDVSDLNGLVKTALALKKDPFLLQHLGENKTLGLIFFNSSLRTRLSTQKAAQNLGMKTIVMNVSQDGWALETENGTIMNGSTVEHIKEGAAVIGQYCDIIGVRSFAELKEKNKDYKEVVLNKFIKYSGVPVLSLESATLHPLQSLADLITIEEYKIVERPKVVLSWAPHPKALPQAVPNSFAQWILQADFDLTIVQPEGYELAESFTTGANISYDQKEAFKNADFIYAKNWSSYSEYGKILKTDLDWMISGEKMKWTNNAKFMHCLPVRRNVIVSDEVMDSENSIVIHQAANRVYSAQAVLKKILEENF